MIVVCKEYDKYRDRPPVHYIACENPTPQEVACIKLRGLFNQELRYFLTRIDEEHGKEFALEFFKNCWNEEKHKDVFVKL